MRVENMTSINGNKIANQFVIHDCIIKNPFDKRKKLTGVMFQSYDSNIVFRAPGIVLLDAGYWDYSVTTGKYRNQFLGENKAATRKRIASGEYKLVDLN